MKWFIAMSLGPFFLFIWGIYKIRKRNKKRYLKDMESQEKKAYVINVIVVTIAFLSTFNGIYLNHKFANRCMQEGMYAQGEIIRRTSPGIYEQSTGYYYDIKIVHDEKERKLRSYAESYYKIHETVGVYYTVDESREILDTMIEGNEECPEGNDRLGFSVILWLLACMIWLKRYDLLDK
jgi:hypothetical protein